LDIVFTIETLVSKTEIHDTQTLCKKFYYLHARPRFVDTSVLEHLQ